MPQLWFSILQPAWFLLERLKKRWEAAVGRFDARVVI